MLETLLSKLGASTRITVGVAISPGVGLEMIEVDRATETVARYWHKPIDYNHSSREIADFTQFENALESLFDTLHIPRNSNIILSLPNVHFGMINLPLLLTDDAVTNAIISEVEQSYIFKRQEPVVTWTELGSNADTENRILAYTAIQKNVLDGILEACKNVGCTVTGIENSYASLLKALSYSGITKEEMKENVTWNLMLVGQNNYSIFSMVGKRILEYYEEPLALKSFVDDEIYNAITISAQLTLDKLPANYLLIVSETDLVSAEVLSMRISTECKINFVECNKFTQNEMIPVNLNILPNMSLSVTPEAIGAAIYPFSDFPLKLNLIKDLEGSLGALDGVMESPRINIGNLEIELTSDFLKRVSLLTASIVILPILILTLILNKLIIPKEQIKLTSINKQTQQINANIEKYSEAEKNNTFDLSSTIDTINKQNRTKLAYYSALGISTPANLWITYYSLSGAGKVDIKGKSKSVKDIYAFYKNMKQLVNESDIRLYKLEVSSDSLDDIVTNISGPKTYDFEITNMSDVELSKPATETANQTPQNQEPQAQATQKQETTDKKSLFQFGKPLFGPANNPSSPDQTQSPIPPPAMPPSNNPQLPNNLQKIERF